MGEHQETPLTERRLIERSDFNTAPQSLPGIKACARTLSVGLIESFTELIGAEVKIEADRNVSILGMLEVRETIAKGRAIQFKDKNSKLSLLLKFQFADWWGLVDCIFGALTSEKESDRAGEPTRVELKIIEKVAARISEVLHTALRPYANLQLSSGTLLDDREGLDDPGEWLDLQFELSLKNSWTLRFSVLLPGKLVQSNRLKFKTDDHATTARTGNVSHYRDSVTSSHVKITAIVEKPYMPLAALLGLEVGSSIELSEITRDFVHILANDNKLYSGHLRQTGNRYAVVVESRG